MGFFPRLPEQFGPLLLDVILFFFQFIFQAVDLLSCAVKLRLLFLNLRFVFLQLRQHIFIVDGGNVQLGLRLLDDVIRQSETL